MTKRVIGMAKFIAENFKKLLLYNIHNTSIIDFLSHGPDKVIYNFSNYNLLEIEKSLLIKGLNFAIQPKKIEYSKFLLLFKPLYHATKSNT